MISTPVTTTKVANEIGVSTHNIGQLCINDNVNKWSLYKPISVNKSVGLTDQDYYDHNFGYVITDYTNYSNMKTAIATGSYLWNYNKPTGTSSSPFRIGDFRKYDHGSSAPFEMEIISSEVRMNSSVSISVSNEISWLTNWQKWSGYQGTSMQYLNCGIYVPNIGYFPLTDTDQGLSIGDLDYSKLSFDIDSHFTVDRTYKCYLVLTTWDGLNGARQWYTPSDTESGTWWVLATVNPPSFTVLPELTPLNSLVQSITNASTQFNEGTVTFTNTKFTATYSLSSSYTSSSVWELSVSFYVDNVLSGSSTKSVLIGSMGSTTFSKDNPASKAISYTSSLPMLTNKDGYLTIRAEISIQDSTHTQVYNETRSFQIEGTIV